MATERPSLEEMTLRQLRKVASEYNISRYSRMRKAQLLAAIQQVQQEQTSRDLSAMEEDSQPEPENPPRLDSVDLPPILENLQPKPLSLSSLQEEPPKEATKFELGQEDLTGGPLTSVDEDLGDLPGGGGYGDSRIVLMPRDPHWAYAYWDVPHEKKEELRRQGGQYLALRLYDVTDINLQYQAPHSVQEYLCDETTREWYLPIPVSDRDYMIDIGYRCGDGRWLVLARSASVRVPPVYPSDWVEDVFLNVPWEEDLQEKTLYRFVTPSQRQAALANPLYRELYENGETQRVAGSIFGSMQHVPASIPPSKAVSSYVFPSGVGLWALPSVSGVSMSGVGFSASAPPLAPRQFWLIANAELIVYGATEPDAKVTISGHPIKLNPDGTFRVQMSFQDGLIDYPIMAVAADGEQTRSIHMKFNRETPSRYTNTQQEAVLEWF